MFGRSSFTTYYEGEDAPPQIQGCADTFRQAFLNHVPENIKCWVAGGAIRTYFENNPPTDFDVFFQSKEDYETFVRWLGNEDATQTYNDEYHDKWSWGDVELDLVHNKWFDTPEDTLKLFDYTICAAAVARDHIVFHDDYFLHLGSRALVPLNVDRNPFETLWRLQKFVGYGYEISRDDLKSISQRLIDDGTVSVHDFNEQRGQENVGQNLQGSGQNRARRKFLSKIMGHGLKKEPEKPLKPIQAPDPYRWSYGS